MLRSGALTARQLACQAVGKMTLFLLFWLDQAGVRSVSKRPRAAPGTLALHISVSKTATGVVPVAVLFGPWKALATLKYECTVELFDRRHSAHCSKAELLGLLLSASPRTVN